MKSSDFVQKLMSKYLWGNILAMVAVVVVLGLGVKFGLESYTHHGESISIPNVLHKSFNDAKYILNDAGLQVEVIDTGYVKTLPAGCVLAQSPGAGERVKTGHIVYLTINSLNTPTITLPDVIDNSSLREAMVKLRAMGFKLGSPEFIPGEKDWVYGVLVRGHHVSTGDRISIDDVLTIQVGNGMRSESDSINYVEPIELNAEGDVDEFEEVTGPPANESPTAPKPAPANGQEKK